MVIVGGIGTLQRLGQGGNYRPVSNQNQTISADLVILLINIVKWRVIDDCCHKKSGPHKHNCSLRKLRLTLAKYPDHDVPSQAVYLTARKWPAVRPTIKETAFTAPFSSL